jgi:hypothetical protein
MRCINSQLKLTCSKSRLLNEGTSYAVAICTDCHKMFDRVVRAPDSSQQVTANRRGSKQSINISSEEKEFTATRLQVREPGYYGLSEFRRENQEGCGCAINYDMLHISYQKAC